MIKEKLSNEIKELKKILRDKWVAEWDKGMYYTPNATGVDLYLDDFTTKATELENKIEQLKKQLEEFNKFMQTNEWATVEQMQTTLDKCEQKYLEQATQLAEKDNEIEALKEETKMLESWKETYYKNWQKAKKELEEMRFRERNLGGLIEKVSSKGQQQIRHQVCEEIRKLETRYRYDEGNVVVGYFVDKSLLDQIEKGERQ